MCFQVFEVYLVLYQGDLNMYNLYDRCAGTSGSGMATKFNPVHGTLTTANFGWAFSWLPEVRKEREVWYYLGL